MHGHALLRQNVGYFLSLFGWSTGLTGTFRLVYWVDGNFLVGLLECRELFGWSIRRSGTFWLGYWVVGNFLVSLLGWRKLFGWATGS